MRSNLLVVRSGDASLHPQWLKREPADARNWDLHISYFGPSADPYPKAAGEGLSHDSGPKYVGLHQCIQDHPHFRDYDLVGFPDDDLAPSQGSWSDIFDVARSAGGAISQPSLDARSFWSHDVTLQRPSFDYRKVDFIELMAPIFNWPMLDRVLPYFQDNQSSWGLDFLWSDIARREHKNMYVIDRASVLHTRAIGAGSQYNGLSPGDELSAFLKKHGITWWMGQSQEAYCGQKRVSRSAFWLNRKHLTPRIFKAMKKAMDLKHIG